MHVLSLKSEIIKSIGKSKHIQWHYKNKQYTASTNEEPRPYDRIVGKGNARAMAVAFPPAPPLDTYSSMAIAYELSHYCSQSTLQPSQ